MFTWYSFLGGIAVKSAIVLMIAFLASLALRRHSAAARHLVWTAAAAALIALPLFSVSLPAIRVAAPLPAPLFEATATGSASAAASLEKQSSASVGTPVAAGRQIDWRLT